jgi:hypothetical protein
MLGGLCPGKAAIEKTMTISSAGYPMTDPLPDPLNWGAPAGGSVGLLQFEASPRHFIQTISTCPALMGIDGSSTNYRRMPQVGEHFSEPGDSPTYLKVHTGYGLGLGGLCRKATRHYDEPDAQSPSTKNGQQIELPYYVLGWAGPDVPQVMAVVCTEVKDGQPGRVVGTTLAAGSL